MSLTKNLLLSLLMLASFQSFASDGSNISCEGAGISRQTGDLQGIEFKIFSGSAMTSADLAIVNAPSGMRNAFIRNLKVEDITIDGFSLSSERHSVNLQVERVGDESVSITGELGNLSLDRLLCSLE